MVSVDPHPQISRRLTRSHSASMLCPFKNCVDGGYKKLRSLTASLARPSPAAPVLVGTSLPIAHPRGREALVMDLPRIPSGIFPPCPTECLSAPWHSTSSRTSSRSSKNWPKRQLSSSDRADQLANFTQGATIGKRNNGQPCGDFPGEYSKKRRSKGRSSTTHGKQRSSASWN